MNESSDLRQWHLIGGNAAWRSGFAFGLHYPSLDMTLQGEVLTGEELDSLAGDLIAVLPAPGLAADWEAQSAVMTTGGIGGVANLLLLAMCHLQRGSGLPVFESGRILSEAGAQARVVIPTSEGSYQTVAHVMRWLVDACGLLRSGRGIGEHANELVRLLDTLLTRHGTHAVSCSLVRTALQTGVPFVALPDKVIEFGQGHLARRMRHSLTNSTSNISVHLSRNKDYTAQILRDAGIPVPLHQVVGDEAEALRVAAAIGYPVVVKPADRDGGAAVSADLRTPAEVSRAFNTARARSTKTLVEKHVPGRDYRITVFQGQAIWAVERLPGGVTGDGRTSVKDLLKQLNSDPRRQASAHSPLKPVPLDDEARALLERDGLSEDSIPANGAFIRLRRAANVATGGTPMAVFDKLHPENARLAVRAAAAMELDLAGVDLLIPDIAQSWHETGAAICEVNSGPDIGQTTAAHLYEPILASLVRGSGRIPVVLVLGAEPGSPIDRLIARGLRLPALTIGYHDRLGPRIGKEKLSPVPVDAIVGGRMLARDRRVQAMILQVNDDRLLDSGLPVPRYDILVIAGSDITAAKPEREQADTQIATNLIRALLPACDGKVLQLCDTKLALDSYRQNTKVAWKDNVILSEVEEIIKQDIKKLANNHTKPFADSG